MATDNQHLKHGKALCGKVFGRFVETFNALVDFMLGLKGDADGKNGEGHITYDRKNNIIRCDGCGGSGSVTANEKSGIKVNDGEIDLSGRKEDDAFGIHTITVHHANGTDDEYDVLSNADIEVYDAHGTVLRDIDLRFSDGDLLMMRTYIDLETGETTSEDEQVVFSTTPHNPED